MGFLRRLAHRRNAVLVACFFTRVLHGLVKNRAATARGRREAGRRGTRSPPRRQAEPRPDCRTRPEPRKPAVQHFRLRRPASRFPIPAPSQRRRQNKRLWSDFHRRSLRRGVCDSIKDPEATAQDFIELRNEKEAKPFKWKVRTKRLTAARQRGYQMTKTDR